MLPRVSTAMFVVVALFALAVDAQETKDDKKAIQGSWTAKKDDKSAKLTFNAEKFTLELGGKTIKGTFTIDSSKTPKHIDLTVTKGSDAAAQKFEGKTSKAIYEFDGDRFKWLAPSPGDEERPTAFPQEGEQARGLYLIFDREKK